MIDDAKFQRGIALLQQHFNRDLSKQAIAIWREFLDENLNDEEFTQAIKEAILSCEFFPTARKLVGFVQSSYEAQAIAHWQSVLTAAKTSSQDWQQQILKSLPIRAQIALKALGGLQAVRIADEKFLNRLEKQFCTVYCSSPLKTKVLLPSSVQHNFVAVEPERLDGPIDLSTKSQPIRRVLENLNLRSLGEEIPIEQVYKNTFARHGWEIDDNRLNHLMTLNFEQIREILNKFSFAIRDKQWRSPVNIFDEITGYQPTNKSIDAKAIARQWLKESN